MPAVVLHGRRYHLNLNILLGKLRGAGGIIKWADVAALKAELEAQVCGGTDGCCCCLCGGSLSCNLLPMLCFALPPRGHLAVSRCITLHHTSLHCITFLS
jgi:hypothetical protein